MDISHTEKFIICCLDQTRIVLIDVADAKFTVIGEYVKKTERRHLEIHEGMARDGMAMGGNNKNAGERTFIKSESKRLRGERIRRVHSKSERDRPDNTRQGATEQMT